MSALAVTIVVSLLVATLTAAATSVRTVSRIWLRHWTDTRLEAIGEAEEPQAPSLRWEDPHDLLLAAGTGIAVLVFALGVAITFMATPAAALRRIFVAALALLIVGQVVPRALARRWGTSLLPALAPVLGALHVLFGPILAFAARVVARFAASAGPEPESQDDALGSLLREAEAEGIGDPGEAEMISDIVEFGDKRVRDVMTPRDRVTSVSRDMPVEAIVRTVATSNYSRVPVFDESGGAVIGVLHAFDVLVHPQEPLATLRAADLADADEPCGVVMRRMLREHRHMAIVLRQGAMAGIVTLEDLVEELVGDIRDEHDEPGAPA